MEGFEATTSSADGVATVLLEGELDIATCAGARRDAWPMSSATARARLSSTSRGCGSSTRPGCARFSARDSGPQTAGRTLRLTNIPVDVERVFDVTGVRRIFDIASPA